MNENSNLVYHVATGDFDDISLIRNLEVHWVLHGVKTFGGYTTESKIDSVFNLSTIENPTTEKTFDSTDFNF